MAPISRSNVTAPDGGWGWIVVLASFAMQALTIGVTYTFGVLFVALLEYFDAGESTTSWIGSIQPALLYLTGIVAGPLIKRYGWRVTSISGSLLSTVGFVSSAFAPNIYLLYFTYGVLTGIGNGLMYVTSMVAVQHYFERRRAMATGLAVSGSGIGTLVFGYLTQTLLDAFGWRWTLVLEGCIMLLGVICGLALRPLPHNLNGGNSDIEDKSESVEVRQPSKVSHYIPEEIDSEKTPLIHTTTGASPHQENDTNCCCGCKPGHACCDIISDTFDKRIWTSPVYIILCFSTLMFCFGYHVPFTYTPMRAGTVYGIPPKQASFLLSIMGIANVLSRLVFGWIADRNQTIRFYMGGIMLTLGGIVSILIFLVTTYPLMVIYSVLFGCCSGCWAALFPVIVVDLMGIGLLEKALGQALAVGSIAFLVASPMSGWIIQMTDNFDLPFIVVGVAETIGGIVYFTMKCAQRTKRHRLVSESPQAETVTPAMHREIARKTSRRISYVSGTFA